MMCLLVTSHIPYMFLVIPFKKIRIKISICSESGCLFMKLLGNLASFEDGFHCSGEENL